jgi:hypothetical protein
MVAGFGRSDMNDNLDYLHFLSNKRHASIVWLTFPGSQQESAVHRLSTTLTQETISSSRLCFLGGYLRGERNSGQKKFRDSIRKYQNGRGVLGVTGANFF